MTRQEMRNFVEAVKTARGFITDEQAAVVPALYPAWREGKAYSEGERVLYNNTLYKVLVAHTSESFWTPDAAASLFAKVLIPNENEIYAWERPESTNPYMIGNKVTHNGKTWISDVDNNVWEPGVYGWSEVTE